MLIAAALILLQEEPIRGLRQPALSPDGARLAFSYLGDLWISPAEGGVAERITATAEDEQKPCWSPDGSSLAFSSDKNDNRDIYVIRLDTRSVRRLTYHTSVDDKPDWSPDGRFIAFHSDRDKNVNLPVDSSVFDVWTARAEGGTAWRLTRFRGENPAWSPDGASIAFDYYSWGYDDGEHDVAVMPVKDGQPSGTPKVLTSGREDSRKPAWKGASLLFAHEANGIASRPLFNVWRTRTEGGALVQVTGLDDARWPATSAGSALIVFEHEFRLWAVDSGAPFPLEITIRDADRPAAGEAKKRTIKTGAYAPDWSAEGDAVLAEIEGNVWKLAPDGSTAEPLTRGPEEDADPAWAPDGRRFAFVSAEPGRPSRLMLWADGAARAMTQSGGSYRAPVFSPDGSTVACEREVDGKTQVVLVDSDGRARVVAEQDRVAVGSPAFTPDGSLLLVATAYRAGKPESKIVKQDVASGRRADVHVAEGFIEDLAVSRSGSLAWSFRASSRANPNIQVSVNGSVTTLPAGDGVSRFQPSWSPDGSMVLFVESRVDDYRTARYDPRARLVFRDVADAEGVLALSFDAPLNQTLADFNRYLFDVVWGAYFREYYDPFLHGSDWEAVRARYLPLAAQARTTPERHDWLNRMIKELRSSHVALHARAPAGDALTRMLGIEYDVLEDGRVRVTSVVPNGPATEIKEGEVITAVGETDLALDQDLDRLMTFPRRPRDVKDVAVAVQDRNGDIRTVYIDPITPSQLRELKHENLMAARRKVVDETGGGRLAYHHIRFMGNSEVQKLRAALEENSDREALVLDIRDGQGGMAHKPVLQLLDETAPERLDRNPACSIRYRNGQVQADKYGRGGRTAREKSWNKPVILIINEISRSDKEILAYTFRHLNVGYVVGMQTAAGVIGGSDRPLPDGSSITVSVQGWFTHDGRNMEGSGAMPDFVVPLTQADAYAGRDPQLARAVELLLAQMEGKIPALQKD